MADGFNPTAAAIALVGAGVRERKPQAVVDAMFECTVELSSLDPVDREEALGVMVTTLATIAARNVLALPEADDYVRRLKIELGVTG